MPALGITGGIGTGKSSFVQALLRHLPARVFDADGVAHELLNSDPVVREAIRERFGAGVFTPEDVPDRLRLREAVFGAPEERQALEAILHPRIRERWVALCVAQQDAPDWLLVDIPLLYETAAEKVLERVVVVACSAETQRARLREKRGLDEITSENIIGAQHDLGLKMKAANHVIWNDSTLDCLEGQARLLARWLTSHHV
jgi:dephospho-CoA kinase